MANNNQFLIIVSGDLNIKSETWYENDKAPYEEAKMDALISEFGI